LQSPVLPDLKTHTLRIIENIDGTLGVEDTTIRISDMYSSDRGEIHHLGRRRVLTSNSCAEA
jgi:hypothetical protein